MMEMELLLGSCNSPNKSAIYCWNYTTGNVEHAYRSPCQSVRNSLCVLLSDFVIVADQDKPLLFIWQVNKQESNVRLVLPGIAQVLCADKSGTYLLAGIETRVYIWMISSGELLNMLDKNYQPISCIKVSNTTENVVIAGKDGFLLTYNFNVAINKSLTAQCDPIYLKTDHSDAITDVSIGNFGCKSRLVSVSLDKTCRVYNLHDGHPLKVLIFNYALSSVIFDSISWNIYVGDTRGTINHLQLEGGGTQHIEDEAPCLKGHFSKITSMDININNNFLATASEDCSIIIWDLKTKRELRKITQELPANCLRFISAHSNIHSKSFRSQVVIKSLKKSFLNDLKDVESLIVQSEDIVFDDNVKTEIRSVNTNNSNVEKLEVINDQLYNVLTQLIRRTYGSDS